MNGVFIKVYGKLHLQLVGGISTPLKNMSSSIGRMTFPTEWKNRSHDPGKPPTRQILDFGERSRRPPAPLLGVKLGLVQPKITPVGRRSHTQVD